MSNDCTRDRQIGQKNIKNKGGYHGTYLHSEPCEYQALTALTGVRENNTLTECGQSTWRVNIDSWGRDTRTTYTLW